MVEHARAVLVQGDHVEPEGCPITALLGREIPACKGGPNLALSRVSNGACMLKYPHALGSCWR
jgi:hypothetical protein